MSTPRSVVCMGAGVLLCVATLVACGGKSHDSEDTKATGGADAGGSGATGGAEHGTGGVGTGGRASGGVSPGSGGATNTGGRSTGGRASGGAASGGRDTGGASPGGAGTGGTATGGATTGGAATGGATTGGSEAAGSETGGSATGGSETGGSETGGSAPGGAGGEPTWVCGDSRCVIGASCDSETGFCECDEGYEGDGWWCLSTAPCDNSPCLNGGVCHPVGGDRVLCTCPANWGGVHCESACTGELSFPDPVLAAAVRREAMLDENAPITAEVAAGINSLGIYYPISDFTGLECLTSVSWLSVDEAALTDLSPFAALPRLYNLYAPCNPLVDLSSVASLINLTTLSLGQDSSCNDDTGVTDISPLAGLEGLVSLDLSGQNIESLVPLSHLTRLEWLVLASNANLSSLAGLEPLSRLRYLVVTDTQVSDLSSLAGHEALETLWLSGSKVADLTPLLGLTSLEDLYIVATAVDCAAQASNLATLEANGVTVTSSCGR